MALPHRQEQVSVIHWRKGSQPRASDFSHGHRCCPKMLNTIRRNSSWASIRCESPWLTPTLRSIRASLGHPISGSVLAGVAARIAVPAEMLCICCLPTRSNLRIAIALAAHVMGACTLELSSLFLKVRVLNS